MRPVLEFHETLTSEAAKHSAHIRDLLSIKVGQCCRQGDVYVTRIKSRDVSIWNVGVEDTKQVAVGQTIGSRHCAEGASVFWPTSKREAVSAVPIEGWAGKLGDAATECVGPVVSATEEWTLTHPEHAHCTFPAGDYLITYQLDRRTMQAVRD